MVYNQVLILIFIPCFFLWEGISCQSSDTTAKKHSGLKETGELDSMTLDEMKKPRCGMADKTSWDVYELQKWRKNNLTYKIIKYSPNIFPNLTRECIIKAFEMWSNVTKLSFREEDTLDHGDINISFEQSHHGHSQSFDGPDNIYGHAFFPYYPKYSGDVHLDVTDQWTFTQDEGVNLLQVVVHELGHALGLLHTENDPKSVMVNSYNGYDENFKLSAGDIRAIQKLYGGEKLNQDYVNQNLRNEDLCEIISSGVDAVVTLDNNQTVVFKGKQFWIMAENGSVGHAKLIENHFEGVSSVDAAFTSSKNGDTYIFKGSKFWRFKNFTLDPRGKYSYPRTTLKVFKWFKSEFIDAAYFWKEKKKIYFYWGNSYTTFNKKNGVTRSNSLPTQFPIDAIFSQHGFIYIFSRDEYWKFNMDFKLVTNDEYSYPQPLELWFGCSQTKEKGTQEPKTQTKKNYSNMTDSLMEMGLNADYARNAEIMLDWEEIKNKDLDEMFQENSSATISRHGIILLIVAAICQLCNMNILK